MGRYTNQLSVLQKKFNVPVICAGDVFHKWNSPPELINWALLNLPTMYAIPGQHDLPHHNYADMHKSAYWTLVQAGRIRNIYPDIPLLLDNVTLHAFPWSFPPKPLVGGKKKGTINLAVVHQYLWKEDYGYPGAPEELRLGKTLPNLKGYDVAVFGDNHLGFLSNPREKGERAVVYNSGGFMATKSDEKDKKCHIGVLMQDGSVHLEHLVRKEDKWEEDLAKALSDPQSEKLEELIEMLGEVGKGIAFDFQETIINYMNSKKVSKEVRKIILDSLEGK